MSIIIKGLTKKFDSKIVLKDFSYVFADKGLYVLTGESGVGKTTLLRMIAGLDKDYTGEIIGGGIGQVGMSFQEYRLFPQLTALQNLTVVFSDTKSEAECKNMLISLGLADSDLRLYPSELSGGMKQRISLARALISNYNIFLLDEPTKELDEKNASLVRTRIRELAMEKLIIVVSHNDEDISIPGAVRIPIGLPG
jgi:ABC-type multidrug transport system ATPase subunit